ncbi:hypothetical protein BDV96DRAFT_564647 [Lophiotrema nucula]|uniref:Uncharacterized protein n=1 Tax=Lophiotrema nucula TaxID=690887 RepID=A0A6A5ZRY0_9PLEO|nr:hypothetical protein BDV96DRAFT_564647 [Lophiotrema nucula]
MKSNARKITEHTERAKKPYSPEGLFKTRSASRRYHRKSGDRLQGRLCCSWFQQP